MTDNVSNQPGLHLLSLDDGGIKGLSSLFIIREMMGRLQRNLERKEQITSQAQREAIVSLCKPCNYFDIIAGSGTGAICAVMLGRLRMGIDETIRAYVDLMKTVFSDRKFKKSANVFKSSVLEKELKKLVRQVAGREDEILLEQTDQGIERCHVIVYAMSAFHMTESVPTPFRSYPSPNGSTTKCTIWEALRATTSHPEMFKHIDVDIEGLGTKGKFAHGSLGCSNPTAQVFEEARQLYPGRRVTSIVSIGTGHPQTIQIAGGQSSQSTMVRVWEAARQMAEGSEGVAEEMAKRFNVDEPKYYRLNVQQGVQGFNTSEWERMDEVAAHTHAYLQKADTSSQLNGLVAKLSERTVLEREIARIVATHEPVSEQAIPSHTHLGARPCQTLADGLETQTPDLVHIITSMLLARRFRQSINPRGEYC